MPTSTNGKQNVVWAIISVVKPSGIFKRWTNSASRLDPHEHLWHHHGNEDQETNRPLERKPIPVEHPRADRAQEGRQNRCRRCDDETVLKRRQEDPIFQKRGIPFQRKPFPANVETRAVERKDDQEEDRDVKEGEDQRRPRPKDPALKAAALRLLEMTRRNEEVVAAATAM